MSATRIVLAVVAAGVGWQLLGGVFYANPWVKRAFAAVEASPAVRKWPSFGAYMARMTLVVVLQGAVLVVGYVLARPALPESWVAAGLVAGALYALARVPVPHLVTALTTTYPRVRIAVEAFNTTVGCVVQGVIAAAVLG